MSRLTRDQAKHIADEHNVWVDIASNQYNRSTEEDALYGWQPIPEEWMEEAKK